MLDNSTQIRVEIITLTLLRSVTTAAVFQSLGPAYQSALSDIKRNYPRLNVTQNIVSDDGKYSTCTDFAMETDNVLGQYYFSNLRKWEQADLTVFIAGSAG